MLTTSIVHDPLEREQLGEVELSGPAAVQGIVDAARAAQAVGANDPRRTRRPTEAAADALRPEAETLGELLARESGKPLAQAQFEVRASIGLLADNARVGRRWKAACCRPKGLAGTARDLRLDAPRAARRRRRDPAVQLPGRAVRREGRRRARRRQRRRLEGADGGAAGRCAVPARVGRGGHPGRGHAAAAWRPRRRRRARRAARGLDAISLTGSTAAGIAVAQAGAPTLRRLHLELGGNNAAIVLADADLDLVAEELAYGRLLMNGQACSAASAVLVDPSLHDELVERLAAVVDRQVLGAAVDPATTVGPLINAAAARAGARRRSRARSRRARGRCAASTRAAPDPARARARARCSSGVAGRCSRRRGSRDRRRDLRPVFALVRADGPQAAVALANASSFGLMASVFSRDVQLALAVAERLEAGGVVINGTDNYRPPVDSVRRREAVGQRTRGTGVHDR